MKNDALTLRLPRELARAVAAWARRHGVPKSLVVREALSHYLAPGGRGTDPPRARITARELADRWPLLPRLDPAEGRAFADDLDLARRTLPAPRALWE